LLFVSILSHNGHNGQIHLQRFFHLKNQIQRYLLAVDKVCLRIQKHAVSIKGIFGSFLVFIFLCFLLFHCSASLFPAIERQVFNTYHERLKSPKTCFPSLRGIHSIMKQSMSYLSLRAVCGETIHIFFVVSVFFNCSITFYHFYHSIIVRSAKHDEAIYVLSMYCEEHAV
jgi:hypothetical protein